MNEFQMPILESRLHLVGFNGYARLPLPTYTDKHHAINIIEF